MIKKKFVFVWEYAIVAKTEEEAKELLELDNPQITSCGGFFINEGYEEMRLDRVETGKKLRDNRPYGNSR